MHLFSNVFTLLRIFDILVTLTRHFLHEQCTLKNAEMNKNHKASLELSNYNPSILKFKTKNVHGFYSEI